MLLYKAHYATNLTAGQVLPPVQKLNLEAKLQFL